METVELVESIITELEAGRRPGWREHMLPLAAAGEAAKKADGDRTLLDAHAQLGLWFTHLQPTVGMLRSWLKTQTVVSGQSKPFVAPIAGWWHMELSSGRVVVLSATHGEVFEYELKFLSGPYDNPCIAKSAGDMAATRRFGVMPAETQTLEQADRHMAAAVGVSAGAAKRCAELITRNSDASIEELAALLGARLCEAGRPADAVAVLQRAMGLEVKP